MLLIESGVWGKWGEKGLFHHEKWLGFNREFLRKFLPFEMLRNLIINTQTSSAKNQKMFFFKTLRDFFKCQPPTLVVALMLLRRLSPFKVHAAAQTCINVCFFIKKRSSNNKKSFNRQYCSSRGLYMGSCRYFWAQGQVQQHYLSASGWNANSKNSQISVAWPKCFCITNVLRWRTSLRLHRISIFCICLLSCGLHSEAKCDSRLSSSEPGETAAAVEISLSPDGQSAAYQLAYGL